MKYLEKYAHLLLDVGVGLQEGQNLRIRTEPYHAKFALLVEQVAYQKGARLVELDIVHPLSRLNRSNYSKEEYLDYVSDYLVSKINSTISEEWALLFIGGQEDPDCLNNLNQKNHGITHKAVMQYTPELIKAKTTGVCAWCIANMPTPNWAQQVFGGEANEENKERLWEAMIPILRLNHDNPTEKWKENTEMIHHRSKVVNDFKPDYLHFQGPGTDLKVFLTQYSCFIGGGQKAKRGHFYCPNLPTEEFFTTPDYRRTEGTVTITRPVEVLGQQIYDGWLKFENGRVVDYGAEKNKEQLDAYFELDDKARFLGEVALVGVDSPIYQSNLIFNDILFDENASCHIALGRGIAMALPEIQEKSAEELDELGCNHSILHTDFMIGSEEIGVTAFSKSGDRLEIMKNGLFQI